MTDREKAIYLLEELKKHRPQIMSKVDDLMHGLQFILKFLYDNRDKEISAGVLSDTLRVSTARIAKVLQSGEEKCWLERYSKPDDKRVTLVRLLPLGEKEVKGKEEELLTRLEKVIASIGEENLRIFLQTLKTINEIFIK